MISPAAFVAAAIFASDSNFCSVKEEWFRLLRSWRQRSSRPILIFVASKKNGFACCVRGSSDSPRPILIFVASKRMVSPAAFVAATIFCVRFYSSLPQRKMVSPAAQSWGAGRDRVPRRRHNPK